MKTWVGGDASLSVASVLVLVPDLHVGVKALHQSTPSTGALGLEAAGAAGAAGADAA